MRLAGSGLLLLRCLNTNFNIRSIIIITTTAPYAFITKNQNGIAS